MWPCHLIVCGREQFLVLASNCFKKGGLRNGGLYCFIGYFLYWSLQRELGYGPYFRIDNKWDAVVHLMHVLRFVYSFHVVDQTGIIWHLADRRAVHLGVLGRGRKRKCKPSSVMMSSAIFHPQWRFAIEQHTERKDVFYSTRLTFSIDFLQFESFRHFIFLLFSSVFFLFPSVLDPIIWHHVLLMGLPALFVNLLLQTRGECLPLPLTVPSQRYCYFLSASTFITW